jgi:predicted DNA-binding transcriptional regulator YafY
MFGGEEQSVKMLCDNSLAGVIIDRFGKEVMMVPVDDEHFEVNVKVAVSRQFIGWVIALGEGVKITEPENVVEQMRKEIYRLNKQYL